MNRPIVLIVDDEPLIAAMIEMTFCDAGYDVRTVIDAMEAASQIAELETRLTALITDIQLGNGSNGWAVAIQARTKLPHLPVVYMTGDSAADRTKFGVPNSVLVQKPFAGEQMLAAVTALLNEQSPNSATD